jgi:iron(III) transport system substrate-binding protein
MKKILALVLALIMVLSLAACGGEKPVETQAPETQAPVVNNDPVETEGTPAEKKPEDYTGNLVVYSPHDPSPLEAGVELFRQAYPNINVEIVIAGTGELTQRIAAEAENPQGDVLWGGGADTLAGFPDLFQPFVSIHDDVIADAYKDANDLWIGESPLPMCFIYNKTLINEEDVPTTWEGLLDESLKGKIAYANPAKSGSAYTQLCTMLFSQPTLDEGWELVDKFIANLDGKLQDGSSACHKLVASGEYVLGITLEKSAVLYADNPDIGFIYPEKNSAVPDGVSLIKNCPNQENAELFINFVLGLECQKDQNVNWKRRPVRSDLDPEGLCALSELDLGNYDFAYAATEKANIIEKWNDLTVD